MCRLISFAHGLLPLPCVLPVCGGLPPADPPYRDDEVRSVGPRMILGRYASGYADFFTYKNAIMKSLFTQLMISGCMLLTGHCLAQGHWPKTIYNPGGGSIHIYQPQVESFTGSILKCKTTIALLAYGDDDPIFGVAWTTDTVKTNQSKREVTIKSVRVDNLRIAADNPPFTEADVRKA